MEIGIDNFASAMYGSNEVNSDDAMDRVTLQTRLGTCNLC